MIDGKVGIQPGVISRPIARIHWWLWGVTQSESLIYESESIAIRNGNSVGIGTQQGNEYRKENTGMRCWKEQEQGWELELYFRQGY